MEEIILSGRLYKNPKLYSPNEDSGLAFFSITAINNTLIQQENELLKHYNVIVLDNNKAKFCSENLSEGTVITLKGALTVRKILENEHEYNETEIIIDQDGEINLLH